MPNLLGVLRAWRSEVARKRGVPAYVVLHDATIDGIAASRPTTPEQLRDIPGIGDKKLERYGRELIALVSGTPIINRMGETAAGNRNGFGDNLHARKGPIPVFSRNLDFVNPNSQGFVHSGVVIMCLPGGGQCKKRSPKRYNRDSDAAKANERNPLNLLIVGGILLIAAIAIGTSFTIVNFRQRAMLNSERELQNTVLLLTRHFDRELGYIDAVQRDLIQRMKLTGLATPEAFKRQISREDAHVTLQTLVSGASGTARINIFDADGQLINSSTSWPVPAGQHRRPRLFQAIQERSRLARRRRFAGAQPLRQGLDHRRSPARSSRPTARCSAWYRAACRRPASRPSSNRWRSATAPRFRCCIATARCWRAIPTSKQMIGQNFSTAPIQKLLRQTDHRNDFACKARSTAKTGWRRRVALSQFPLSVIATVKVSTALADWREQTRFLVGAAGLSALVIALTLFLIVRKLSAQHQNAERRLALEKERLDTAVNNMSQGLLLYDEDARIVLFNQRYLDMYGLSPEVVKPGLHFRDLIAYRKQIGSFKGDVDAFCSSVAAQRRRQESHPQHHRNPRRPRDRDRQSSR